jgi:site-specific DNA-methyltransferase (adenine-specific)
MIERGPNWELRLGDCIEGMSGLADDSVDVTITDPPYEAEVHGQGRRVRDPGGEKGAAKYRKCVEAPLPFEAITESQRAELAFEISRTTRRWTLVFCQVEAAHKWASMLALNGLDYVRTMVWVKPDGQPQFTGDRPGMGYESIVVAHRKGRKRWNGGGRVGVFTHNKFEIGNKHGAPHPTTKPQTLMRELVSLFSDPDELILDPFSGSGSTGVACNQLNRRFLGFELNRDYFDIACRRLRGDEAKPRPEQPSLFGRTA